jgi:hypothetical protein
MDIRGSILIREGIFLCHRVHTISEAHSTSCPMKTGVISMGVKRPGHEAKPSRPPGTEVNNSWSYTSTSPIRLHGVVLD